MYHEFSNLSGFTGALHDNEHHSSPGFPSRIRFGKPDNLMILAEGALREVQPI